MSFSDRLRQLNVGPDYREREKLLADTAEKCVDHFACNCEAFAVVGYTTWKESMKYEIGEFTFTVYVFRTIVMRKTKKLKMVFRKNCTLILM